MTYKQRYDLAHAKDYRRNRIIRCLIKGFIDTTFAISFMIMLYSILLFNSTGEGTKMFVAGTICTFVTAVLNCFAYEVMYGDEEDC